MKEYLIKLVNVQNNMERVFRKFLTDEVAKFSMQNIGKVDKNGDKLVDFFEIKGIKPSDFKKQNTNHGNHRTK